MDIPDQVRRAAVDAWLSRRGQEVAAVDADILVAGSPELILLDLRQITFRLGVRESYLVVFTAVGGTIFCCFAVPDEAGGTVTLEEANGRSCTRRCDRNGYAVFVDVAPGPIRLHYRLSGTASGPLVESEWVLVSRAPQGVAGG